MPVSAMTAPPACPAMPGIKLAQPIQHAIIISFERRPDQKMWYVIQVNPQQTDLRLVNGRVDTLPVVRHSYTIARRYEDFCQFAQRLHDAFPSSKSLRAGSRHKEVELPKLKGRLHLLPSRQMHVQRRAELDRFIQALFRLPPSIAQSLVVLEFFGVQKIDADQQVVRDPHDQHNLTRQCDNNTSNTHNSTNNNTLLVPPQSSRLVGARSHERLDRAAVRELRKTSSQPNLAQNTAPAMKESPSLKDILSNTNRVGSSLTMDRKVPVPTTPSSRWRRLRCTSFRNRTPSTSTSLSSLCTQAANMILPWSRNPAPRPPPASSISSPVPKKQPKKAPQPLTTTVQYRRRPSDQPVSPASSSSIVSSVSSSRISQSTCATSVAPSPSTSPTLRMIKIKVIYDVDNIVVIQVPRSIAFDDLKHKITQKFSDPTMEAVQLDKDFVLLYNDARSSASSSYDASPAAATLIAKQQDLVHAMNSKWERLEKVTIRCIV